MVLQYADMADELFEVERRAPGGDAANGDDAGGTGGSATPSETIVLRLHVQPGAGRAAVAGRHGDALHVRVAPPPADGRANAAAVALVAELLDIAPSRVELIRGEKSREKRVRVTGVDPDAVHATLTSAIEHAGTTGAPGRGRGGRIGR
jgi:hypothetical protein